MTATPVRGDQPLVAACLRVCDLRPEVDPLTGSIHRDVWGMGLAAADAAALEHALRISDAWSGRVVAVAVGPAAIEPVLREVAALGVSVVRVPTETEADTDTDTDLAYRAELGGDEWELARTIVAALERWGPPSVVLCGDRSADRGTGALPGFVAHELGAAQALGLVDLDVAGPGADGGPAPRVLVAERRLDGGWREQLRVPLPAVCSVEGAGVRLRRASLAGALASAAAPIPVERATTTSPMARATAGQVGPVLPYRPRTRVLPPPENADPRFRLLALTGALVAHDPPTVIGPVSAADAVDHLMGFLVRHGYLDGSPGPDHDLPTGGEVER